MTFQSIAGSQFRTHLGDDHHVSLSNMGGSSCAGEVRAIIGTKAIGTASRKPRITWGETQKRGEIDHQKNHGSQVHNVRVYLHKSNSIYRYL